MTSRDVVEALFEKLKAAGRLPSPPGIAMRVVELARDENGDIGEIAAVIQSDPALAARILRFANSAVVGCGREVTSIRAAVMMTGLRAVKMTCLGFIVPEPKSPNVCAGFDLTTWCAEGFLRATLARTLGAEFFNVDRESAFSAGLLARVGQLAFAQGLPKLYGPILQATAPLEIPAAERVTFGVDHVDFGARLLEEWGLPAELVNAVAAQLDPDQAPEEARAVARTLHLVSRLAPLFPTGVRRESAAIDPERFRLAYLAVERELGLGEERWREITARVLTDFHEIARIFDLRLESDAAVIDLYADARRETARLGMVLQLEQTELYHEYRQRLKAASSDELTGCANRARFEQRMEELLVGLRRCHTDFALLVFDIDSFGSFEQEHGDECGADLLRRIGRVTLGTLRDSDLVARIGRDEFAILAPETDAKGCELLAQRLHKIVGDVRINPLGTPLGVTASVGVVSSSDYERVPSVRSILLDVDEAVMRTKNAGRNGWSFRERTEVAPVPQAALLPKAG